MSVTPPADLDELLRRARSLAGRPLAALAASLGLPAPRPGAHTKGQVGALVERALGASAGARAVHDFPHLGVELKTIPVDRELRPRESTFVCKISLAEAEHAEWATSWARRKLQRVLFFPVVERTCLGTPVLFIPTAADEAILRADFDTIMGAIGTGRIEELDARVGTYLQLRPKARDGRVRELMWDPDGEAINTVPRGLYLRARFTAAVLSRRSGGKL